MKSKVRKIKVRTAFKTYCFVQKATFFAFFVCISTIFQLSLKNDCI